MKKGEKHTEESRKKISEAAKKRISSNKKKSSNSDTLTQKEIKQKQFIQTLIQNNFLIQKSCDAFGIHYRTYQEWCKDQSFKDSVEDALERKLDMIEEKLYKLIEKGDVTTTIFMAKCLLKKRGYVDKKEVEVSGNLNVRILNVDPIENKE